MLERVKAERADTLTAWRRGLFCGLGQGDADVERFCAALADRGYDGWVVVEQDRVLADGGAFAAAAAEQARNRHWLREHAVVEMTFDVITIGRIGVDVYPLQTGSRCARSSPSASSSAAARPTSRSPQRATAARRR